jgi:hypothetical protein
MKKVITEEIFKIYPQKRTESFSEATHFSFETPTIIQIKPSIEADNDSSDNVPDKACH